MTTDEPRVPTGLDGTAGSRFKRLGPAYEQVAAQVRAAIMTGELPRGTRLPPESELCEMFGVSRSTLRDALRGLAAEGLITTTKGVKGGSFVTAPSLDRMTGALHVGLELFSRSDSATIGEFMELRELLEIPAARLAAQRRTPEDVERLVATLPDLDGFKPGLVWFEQNVAFHVVLVSTAHNRFLEMAARPLLQVLHGQMTGIKVSRPEGRIGAEQHHAIAEAIADGDEAKSEQVMREHMTWLRSRYRSMWMTGVQGDAKDRPDAPQERARSRRLRS